MKVTNRYKNEFDGSYIGYHDEMETKGTPVYLKVLVVFMALLVVVGVLVSIFVAGQGNAEAAVLIGLGILIVDFPLMHLTIVLFDKAKYGKVRRTGKLIGTIFSSCSALILVGVILSRFIHFAIVLTIGSLVIFYAIGIGLVVAGSKQMKEQKKNCTMPVWAVCSGYETLTPHLSVLDDADATYTQNQVIATAQVEKPIWEFNYNGQTVHATPDHYEGKLKIIENKQYKIFVNPENPQEVYCDENNNARQLQRMGIFWLIFTTVVFPPTVAVALFVLLMA